MLTGGEKETVVGVGSSLSPAPSPCHMQDVQTALVGHRPVLALLLYTILCYLQGFSSSPGAVSAK